jgi:hypothetical protein
MDRSSPHGKIVILDGGIACAIRSTRNDPSVGTPGPPSLWTVAAEGFGAGDPIATGQVESRLQIGVFTSSTRNVSNRENENGPGAGDTKAAFSGASPPDGRR